MNGRDVGNERALDGDGSISRRQLVAGALAAGTALTLTEMRQRHEALADEAPSGNAEYSFQQVPDPIDESEIADTTECDIVIVGAGVAAMTGIIYAAEAGVDVEVLEKSSHQGVHRLSMAGINGSKMVEAAGGVTVDPEQYAKDFLRYSGGFQSKINNVSRYAKDSGHMIDWIDKEIGEYGWQLILFPGATQPDSSGFWTEYPGAYWIQDDQGNDILSTGTSPDWMALFRQIAEDKGAHFHFNEPGVRLIREEGEGGRVTGVISQSKIDGSCHRYNARLGVLCAAGDFYNDKEMVHKFAPHLEKCVSSICEPNNTGDMHKAGIWVGAAMDDYSAGDLFAFENAKCLNWVGPVKGDEEYNPMIDTCRACMWCPAVAGWPVMWVDDGGRRFVNEDQNMFQLAGANAVLGTSNGLAWSIWDSAWESKFPEGWQDMPVGALLMLMSVTSQGEVDREVEAGIIDKYDTIDELIDGCGFDRDVFQEELDRYNKMCADGYDDECFKSPLWMTTIDTPPYYAAHWGVMITSTRCGLKTDERARVIDTAGKVIPGLYAAGNNGGNFYGLIYPATMGGTGIGHGQFYSWTAVRDMLGEDVINPTFDDE
jgi:fumarate reductase flavoprotein subunit